LLTGTGVQTATTVTLTSNTASAFVGQAITFTATVKPTGMGTPAGSVSFYDGATLIGSAALIAGSASFAPVLIAGTHTITAVYAGDANFTGSTSSVLSQLVVGFSVALDPSTPETQVVVPGQPVTFAFNLMPNGGSSNTPITLSATGLPPGATATFSPQVITLGASPVSFTMTIQTVATGASLDPGGIFGTGYRNGTIALGLLLLPFSCRMRRRVRSIRLLTLVAILVLSLTAIGGLVGCGAGSGYFGQPSQNYTINIIATGSGMSGAAPQHLTSVTLTVQ
jgi:hypothetical protein